MRLLDIIESAVKGELVITSEDFVKLRKFMDVAEVLVQLNPRELYNTLVAPLENFNDNLVQVSGGGVVISKLVEDIKNVL